VTVSRYRLGGFSRNSAASKGKDGGGRKGQACNSHNEKAELDMRKPPSSRGKRPWKTEQFEKYLKTKTMARCPALNYNKKCERLKKETSSDKPEGRLRLRHTAEEHSPAASESSGKESN